MVVGLAAMRRATFAYALANGTIGVYDQPGQRKWRVKSKHEACAIVGFDLDGDGQPEVISGWSNGKLEVRSHVTASSPSHPLAIDPDH
jgi:Bardet-Biedl syndrome 2 protein